MEALVATMEVSVATTEALVATLEALVVIVGALVATQEALGAITVDLVVTMVYQMEIMVDLVETVASGATTVGLVETTEDLVVIAVVLGAKEVMVGSNIVIS